MAEEFNRPPNSGTVLEIAGVYAVPLLLSRRSLHSSSTFGEETLDDATSVHACFKSCRSAESAARKVVVGEGEVGVASLGGVTVKGERS